MQLYGFCSILKSNRSSGASIGVDTTERFQNQVQSPRKV